MKKRNAESTEKKMFRCFLRDNLSRHQQVFLSDYQAESEAEAVALAERAHKKCLSKLECGNMKIVACMLDSANVSAS